MTNTQNTLNKEMIVSGVLLYEVDLGWVVKSHSDQEENPFMENHDGIGMGSGSNKPLMLHPDDYEEWSHDARGWYEGREIDFKVVIHQKMDGIIKYAKITKWKN